MINHNKLKKHKHDQKNARQERSDSCAIVHSEPCELK
jgi:hypothetical protein